MIGYLFIIMIIAIALILSIYKVVCLFGGDNEHSKINKMRWCAWYCVIIAICIAAAFALASLPIRNINRVVQFEKYISQECSSLGKVQFSSERGTYEVDFYICVNGMNFKEVEDIFFTILDELLIEDLIVAINSSKMYNDRFTVSNICISFCDIDNYGTTAYSFSNPQSHNYNNWKVIVSSEPEYLNKGYYFDIAPEPPISSDIGRGLI